METAFEIILKNSESVLSGLYGDLDNHRLKYKGKCIYDGEFHTNPLADFPAGIELLPKVHKYNQDEWVALLAAIYDAYKECTPKRNKHLNFISGDTYTNSGYPDFHHRRVILDMFIVFGYHMKLFSWNNPKYFMLRACEGCVVYKRWVI